MSEEMTEREHLEGVSFKDLMDAFFRPLEKEEDMTGTGDLLNRLGGGEEDKAPHITRLETEQDKATLAKELLDVAVPFVTVESIPLDTNDVIDVFVDIAERLRTTLHGKPVDGDTEPPF